MKVFFGVTLSALALLVWCRAPLSWDGGWIFFTILDSHAPVLYGDRFISVPLHSLVVIASRFTDNLRILESVFSLVYAGAPVAALALSWWVVRRSKPSLFIWAALGIGLGTLPGQFNFLSDCIMAVNLFWPVYLSILCGVPRSQVAIVAVLALAVLFTHPVAIPLFAVASAVALLMGWRHAAARKRMWIVAAAFGVTGVVKLAAFLAWRPAYDSSEASVAMQLQHFRLGVSGIPIEAVACAWLVAGAIYLAARAGASAQRRSAGMVLNGVQWMGVLAAGAILTRWAIDPARWAYALDFRDWAMPCALPFMGFAVLETVSPELNRSGLSRMRAWRRRLPVAQAVAVIFLIVLGTQSTVWSMLSSRLQESMAGRRAGCTSLAEMKWPVDTPLNHWATPAYAALLQGRNPTVLVLYRGQCSQSGFAEAMRFDHAFHVVQRDGWFTLPQ